MVKSLDFPSQLEQKLEQVNLRNSSTKQTEFGIFRCVTCQEAILNGEKKNGVNSGAEGVAILSREVDEIFLPNFVAIFQLQHHSDKFWLQRFGGG